MFSSKAKRSLQKSSSKIISNPPPRKLGHPLKSAGLLFLSGGILEGNSTPLKESFFVNVPSDLKYTSTHEWVRLDGDVATIGITDYAQSELGDVVYVELPNVGRSLSAGESMGSVESVKTVSEIYAPIAGEVVEVNPALGAQSELVNSSPYDKGYLVKIRLADSTEAQKLQDAAAYEAILQA